MYERCVKQKSLRRKHLPKNPTSTPPISAASSAELETRASSALLVSQRDSSFGDTVDEAIRNLKEAVELHFEDNKEDDFRLVEEVLIGESLVNA